MTTFKKGVTDAWFEPRNRWGGAKIHAVKQVDFTTKRGDQYGVALCGAGVQVMGPRPFYAEDFSACKRCAKKAVREGEVAQQALARQAEPIR